MNKELWRVKEKESERKEAKKERRTEREGERERGNGSGFAAEMGTVKKGEMLS